MSIEQSRPPRAAPPWLRWLPFLGDHPALSSRQWTLFLLVVLPLGLSAYAVALLQLALPQIQADLAISDAERSGVLAIIRLGALPAFGLALLADSWGRRRLLIGATLATALCTTLTVFAPTSTCFVISQFVARIFMATTGLLAHVMVIEEFPEGSRGWGVGALTALGSMGGGLAAALYGGVAIVPWGWRTLLLLGVVGFPLALWMHRRLPETTRFTQIQVQQTASAAQMAFVRPLMGLIRSYPQRFLLLALVVILVNLGGDAALLYDPTYLQQAHGWQPWQIALLNLCAGFMALIGSALGGRWGDRWGRRPTTAGFLVGFAGLAMGYYNGVGWLLPVLWGGFLFTSIGALVSLGALSSELFPTAYRSTAAGATAIVATVSGVLSLVVHGWLLPFAGSPWLAVTLLLTLLFLAAPLVLLLPETGGRALEEIAPE